MNSLQQPPAWAKNLGYAGLIPFLSLAAITLLLPQHKSQAQTVVAAYGAVIVSFLGAIHWGWGMRDASKPGATISFIWGVVPSLLGWVALLLPDPLGLFSLVATLWLCYMVDRKTYRQRQLAAWLPMRLGLTTIASLCCLTTSIA